MKVTAMRSRLFQSTLLAASLLLATVATPAADPMPPKGFAALFNGKDLTGWHGMPHFDPYKLEAMKAEDRTAQIEKWTEDAKKHWKVEKDELVNDGHGAYLTTDKEYGDIELLIEYKTVPKADSGIYLRGTPQVQIWDSNQVYDPKNPTRKPHLGSGGLFNNTPGAPGRDPLILADKPFGEWNSFRIIQVGERTTVYLNDKLVVDHARLENFWNRKLPLRKKGPIQLQTHGGEIRWRNLFLREIPSTEANELLRKQGAKDFEAVFNGKDFTGWNGPIENYEIMDGAIVCKPKKGGNIYTKDQYADFVARVEYKLPEGGNNGLAIRYLGKGQPSSEAMCEIQLLDDDAPKYAKLDARQFNGSAYGMAAAHRGYLRPTGEWNLMEVTARGSTLQVELNGTRTLDTDLAKVTDFMGGKPHPGKDNAMGHFGFCGHNDPVAFRNIEIKRLEKK